jgi:FkbM family methyltransferase
MKYYSQFQQDKFVNENYFKNKTNGFFIDIGAHDGIIGSNSKFFEEELGWSGICIEPNPEVFFTLENSRRCNCIQKAISNKKETSLFFQFLGEAGNMLSGLADKYSQKSIFDINKGLENNSNSFNYIEVECDLFENIVKETHIDFLSIDTEGNELEILETIDFNKYNIDIISVENNEYDDKFINFFSNKNYTFITKLGCDEIYKKQ